MGSSSFGYALIDIDKDNKKELVIGESGTVEYPSILYDMYMMDGKKMVHVFSGGERDRYYATDLTVVKGLLKVTNARIDTCMSGMECLKMIRDKHYDVILLDHMMPEMDGIETLHKARELKDSKCEDSMYIALTANAISGVKEMYLSEGFDGYLSKPIDSKQLESILASATKG